LLRIDAPCTHTAEVNRLLAQNEIFAAELHPYEGSLEEVYLQLTTPSGEHLGMAALAGISEPAQTLEDELPAGSVLRQRKGGVS
jgi:ABC-2 type transport system ATP-binding protein